MATENGYRRGSLEHAICLATKAFEGVKDKGGKPYIFHCLRVMMGCTDPRAQIVGVLHDVVEDCNDWSFARLSAVGFSDDIIEAVDAVTKRADEHGSEDEAYMRFIKRIMRGSNIAIEVKLADLTDNLDPNRTFPDPVKAEKMHRRYTAAKALLLAEQARRATAAATAQTV